MTEVNGLRLAYRGFVTGLAAAYAWIAAAMLAAAGLYGDPLAPLHPLAAAIIPAAAITPELAFVLAFALVQAGGALLGMCFSYFFGRFFTDRRTLAVAAPCFAVLAWALLATGIGAISGADELVVLVSPVVGTLAYGLLLGAGLPLRGDVLRQSGSPST
jgi:hypothetical protein